MPDPLRLPDPCLVIVAAARAADAGAVAQRMFADTAVLSVAGELARIGDDPDEPALRREAERSLAGLIATRLGNHRPTVVAAGAGARERAGLLAVAHGAKAPCVLMVCDATPQAGVRPRAAADHRALLDAARDQTAGREGFDLVCAVSAQEPTPVTFGDRHLRDVDVIGDVHGCLDELEALLTRLGYRDLADRPSHPDGRVAVFVGDLVDHGPDSAGVVLLADRMVSAGCARIGAIGNHDWRLFKRLVLHRRTNDHGGLGDTLAQFHDAGSPAVSALARLFSHAPSHSVYDDGALVVCHGAIRPDLVGRRPVRMRDDEARELSMYGERLGDTDAQGLLRRSHRWLLDWPADGPTVAFGHDILKAQPARLGEHAKAITLDCGCCEGGSLAALRWPAQTVCTVPSRQPAPDHAASQLAAA